LQRCPQGWFNMLCLLPCFLLCFLLQGAKAKHQFGTLRLGGLKSPNKWKYVSKFAYGIGAGQYAIRVKLTRPRTLHDEANMSLEFYLDEKWPDAEAIKDPCERRKLVHFTSELIVNNRGKWGPWSNGTCSQRVRPHVWFVAVSECNESHGMPSSRHTLEFEFHARQENGSHFGVEMHWMLESNMIYLIGFTLFLYRFRVAVSAFLRSAGSIHTVIWTLTAAMVLQYVAQCCHTLHLWVFRYNGAGLWGLDLVSEMLLMVAQVIQSSLLILIALGYTLLQSTVGDLDLMLLVSSPLGVIHIIIVAMSKLGDGHSYKFHENEGVFGWVLLTLRLLLYIWFMWAVRSTASTGGMNIKSFLLGQFQTAGSLYFLAYPLIFVATQQFAPYWQHFVLTTGLMIMQMGSNFWLASLFLQRGEYFKVSTLNASLLPGGARVGVDKEE